MTTATQAAKILVVDDEQAICQSLADALRGEGFEALVAASGREALSVIEEDRPDLVIADLRLGDCTGPEVIDRIRDRLGDLPAIIITGCGDARSLSDASRCRPVELVSKPFDLGRLLEVVREELSRRRQSQKLHTRHRRLREVSRRVSRQRRGQFDRLTKTCAHLAVTCRQLRKKHLLHEKMINFQTDLIGCRGDDDIFKLFFRFLVENSGPLFGAALLCDENAELEMVGRFGVPGPDGVGFCRQLVKAVLPSILQRPAATVLDAYEHLDLFPQELHRKLIGVTLMAVPLMAGEGKLIGLVVLYRRGEQPFTEEDIALAEQIAVPTSAAAQRS